MKDGKLAKIGGYVSGGVLIAFGIAVIALGIYGFISRATRSRTRGSSSGLRPIPPSRSTRRSGPANRSRPEARRSRSRRSCASTRSAATDGLTYAEMGRYQSAENPTDKAGTNDEAAAAKDENGEPISNGARDIWVTETALTTALNVGYMAEMLSIFSIVVGIALLLAGIGFVILAYAVFGRRKGSAEAVSPAPAAGAAPG